MIYEFISDDDYFVGGLGGGGFRGYFDDGGEVGVVGEVVGCGFEVVFGLVWYCDGRLIIIWDVRNYRVNFLLI